MKVTFTQGILSGLKNSLGNPAFLEITPQGIVKQLAKATPTVLVIAHRSNNYVININDDVMTGWGTFADNTTPVWLYWDVNIVTGAINRGYTNYEPIYSDIEPLVKEIGQSWFSGAEKVFREWTGSEWMEKIRLFAAVVHHKVISHYGFGSQAGLVGDYYAGYIMFDSSNKPIRISNSAFLTTETITTVKTAKGISTVKLDQNVMLFEADESIPAYSLVYVSGQNKIRLASISNFNTAAIGVVDTAVPAGSAVNVVFRGQIYAEDWSMVTTEAVTEFAPSDIGKQLYLGKDGKITINPGYIIYTQKIGTIVGLHSIYLDIDEMHFTSAGTGDIIPGPKGDPGPPGGSGFQAVAGDAIGGHRICILDNAGKLQYASNSQSAHAQRIVGITLTAVAVDDTVTLQNFGDIFESSWNWDVSLPVFLGENGILTQEPPVAPEAKFSLIVGFPTSPTSLFVNISQPIFIN